MPNTPIRDLTQKYNHKEILSKCKTLLAGKSLSAITSDEISKFCGYSKKTIYAYFKSKDDILNQIQFDCIDTFLGDMAIQHFANFESFIEYLFTYKQTHETDFFFIAQKQFQKNNEEDYFFFSENFKPLLDFLVEKCNFIYTSLDVPLLMWNSILFGIKNDVQPSFLCSFLLGKCFT